MKSDTLVEDIDKVFDLPLFRDSSNASFAGLNDKPGRADAKMTAEDWNKFEKDIADAFEKVP